MRDIYTSIDIGTDSIKVITAEYYDDKYNILAFSCVSSAGVKKGLIVDANLVTTAIKKAIKQVQNKLGTKIEKVLAVVPSNNIKIDIVNSKMKNSNENKIIDGDLIFNCMQKSLKNVDLDGREVVGVFPALCILDNDKQVLNPLGLESEVLSIKNAVLSVPNKNVYSVVSILKEIGIEVIDVAISSVCDYYAMKSKELDNKISAIINIGEEKTNVAVFNKGIIIKDSIMPVGSRNIDSDISNTYDVNMAISKKIKEEFAVSNRRYADSEEVYTCKNEAGEKVEINQYKLADLVETRIIDILKNAKTLINNLTNKEIGYIIVTGGLTSMLGFNAIASDVYSRNATCLNIGVLGIRENKYGTCFGMIKYFVDKLELREKEYTMFSDTNIEEMLSTSKKTGTSSVIGKIFGKIFD